MTSATTGLGGLAGRYALALFELAEQEKSLDRIADELSQLAGLIRSSDDLLRLIRSPIIGRDDQRRAMEAIIEAMNGSALTRRFVSLVVSKRRLHALPDMIKAYLGLIAARRGRTTAEVISAKPLTKAQAAGVAAALKSAAGMEVALATRVDPALLGGLVVKLGSRMVDSSLSAKLNRLSLAIKGMG